MKTPINHESDLRPSLGFDEDSQITEQMEFDFDSIVVDEQESIQPTSSDATADVADSSASEVEDSETGLEVDSPLYGDEDGDTFDWKSVDILTENDDVPPQDDANTPSDGDDTAETEHSRSGDGAPRMGLITLKPEHSEQSEPFSSPDFEDPDWISPIYPESMWQTLSGLGDACCEECTKTSVKVTALNPALFACSVILSANLHMHHTVWYIYYEVAGAWRILRKSELLNVIHRCVIAWGEKKSILEIVKLCSRRFCGDVMSFMMPFPEYENIFDRAPKYVINVKNGTLVIDSDGYVVIHGHSPEFLCRNTVNIDYEEPVNYTGFVREMFGDHISPEDLDVMQKNAGQCLLGWNVTQTILLISGEA